MHCAVQMCVKVAEVALSRLRHLASVHWRVEEAELFWARGELETAKCKMKKLIDEFQTVCRLLNDVCVCFSYRIIFDNMYSI